MMGRMTEEDMAKDYKALLNAYGDESDIAKYLELQDELVARDAAQRATIQQLEARVKVLSEQVNDFHCRLTEHSNHGAAILRLDDLLLDEVEGEALDTADPSG